MIFIFISEEMDGKELKEGVLISVSNLPPPVSGFYNKIICLLIIHLTYKQSK